MGINPFDSVGNKQARQEIVDATKAKTSARFGHQVYGDLLGRKATVTNAWEQLRDDLGDKYGLYSVGDLTPEGKSWDSMPEMNLTRWFTQLHKLPLVAEFIAKVQSDPAGMDAVYAGFTKYARTPGGLVVHNMQESDCDYCGGVGAPGFSAPVTFRYRKEEYEIRVMINRLQDFSTYFN